MLHLPDLLAGLAEDRPVFHSEADFQHALAWEIHIHHPAAKVRLEYRPANVDTKLYIDIWTMFPNCEVAAIELKYKTRQLDVDHAGETFRLVNQGAPDQGRYDFLHDIERLEEITAATPAIRGAAVILSNDSTYWAAPSTANTFDAAFRIHEGRSLAGDLAWGLGLPPVRCDLERRQSSLPRRTVRRGPITQTSVWATGGNFATCWSTWLPGRRMPSQGT